MANITKGKNGKGRISGYLVFFREHREEVKDKNPGIKFMGLSEKLGTMWCMLSAAEKAKWDTKARVENEENGLPAPTREVPTPSAIEMLRGLRQVPASSGHVNMIQWLIDRQAISDPHEEDSHSKETISGFISFSGEHCKGVKTRNPTLTFFDVVKELGTMWYALSDAEKAKWGTTAIVENEENGLQRPTPLPDCETSSEMIFK